MPIMNMIKIRKFCCTDMPLLSSKTLYTIQDFHRYRNKKFGDINYESLGVLYLCLWLSF